jgi:hypothetical protein
VRTSERACGRRASYRCCLALADDTFSQDADLLPSVNEEYDLGSYRASRGAKLEYDLVHDTLNARKFVLEIGRYRHLLVAVDTLSHRLLIQRDSRVFAPLVERRLSKESPKQRVLLDHRVVAIKLGEPKPSSARQDAYMTKLMNRCKPFLCCVVSGAKT